MRRERLGNEAFESCIAKHASLDTVLRCWDNIQQFQQKDTPMSIHLDKMKLLVLKAQRFNELLAEHDVRNMMEFPEFYATFINFSEKSRDLQKISPSRLKKVWLNFAQFSDDGGNSAEVLVKIDLSGPLEDRNVGSPAWDRKMIFTEHADCEERKFKSIISKEVTKAQLDAAKDNPTELTNLAKQAVFNNHLYKKFLFERLGYTRWLATADGDALVEKIKNSGIPDAINKICKFYPDKENPLLMLDHKMNFGKFFWEIRKHHPFAKNNFFCIFKNHLNFTILTCMNYKHVHFILGHHVTKIFFCLEN
jgi:hypothetical protein